MIAITVDDEDGLGGFGPLFQIFAFPLLLQHGVGRVTASITVIGVRDRYCRFILMTFNLERQVFMSRLSVTHINSHSRSSSNQVSKWIVFHV